MCWLFIVQEKYINLKSVFVRFVLLSNNLVYRVLICSNIAKIRFYGTESGDFSCSMYVQPNLITTDSFLIRGWSHIYLPLLKNDNIQLYFKNNLLASGFLSPTSYRSSKILWRKKMLFRSLKGSLSGSGFGPNNPDPPPNCYQVDLRIKIWWLSCKQTECTSPPVLNNNNFIV